MNAYVLRGVNQLTYEQVDIPIPGPGEVILQVKACGVCGSDLPRIYRTGAHTYPLIPGHEFAGIVVETGAQADAIYWENQLNCKKQVEGGLQGKRMGVFPLIPCGTCSLCREGRYELCRQYGYLGSRRNGGFAEYVAVPAANLIEIPDSVSFEAAAMLEPMAVAIHAMRRAGLERLSKDETIAVCGLGTIGVLLLVALQEAGFQKIVAIGNKPFQQQLVLKSGLPQSSYCDSKKEEPGAEILEKTGGRGASVFFECVGKEETVSFVVNHTAPAGKVVLVGNPDSDIKLKQDIYWKILRNQLTITGTWNSSFNHQAGDDWQYALKRLEQKRVELDFLITHRFSLKDLEKGLHIMRDKTEEHGKIMVIG